MRPRPIIKVLVYNSVFDCLNEPLDTIVNNSVWNAVTPSLHAFINGQIYLGVFNPTEISIYAAIQLKLSNTVFEFMKAYE